MKNGLIIFPVIYITILDNANEHSEIVHTYTFTLFLLTQARGIQKNHIYTNYSIINARVSKQAIQSRRRLDTKSSLAPSKRIGFPPNWINRTYKVEREGERDTDACRVLIVNTITSSIKHKTGWAARADVSHPLQTPSPLSLSAITYKTIAI